MKIYDGTKIIPGLVVFLGLISFPVWHNLANGKATYRPNPQIPPELLAAQKHCVEPGPAMRASHMDLLNQWRDQVVRQNMRVYVSARDGSEWSRSFVTLAKGASGDSFHCVRDGAGSLRFYRLSIVQTGAASGGAIVRERQDS